MLLTVVVGLTKLTGEEEVLAWLRIILKTLFLVTWVPLEVLEALRTLSVPPLVFIDFAERE